MTASGKEALDSFTRRALAATAVMNIGGSIAFTPVGDGLRTGLGIPPAHPVWGLMVASFILTMGFGYAALAFTGRFERTFLTVAAVGKALFAVLLLAMGALGEIAPLAACSGLPDLVFAAIFVRALILAR
jgi:hypothetical protein